MIRTPRKPPESPCAPTWPRRARASLLVSVALAFAACQPVPETAAGPSPDAPTAPAAAEAATSRPAQAIDAVAIADMTSPVADAPPGFDTKAFAGTYSAPGTTLAIDAGGSYRMRVDGEGADGGPESTGTWTLEADGIHVLLDPDSKSGVDRRYALAPGELRPDAGGPALRRGD